MNNKVPLSDLCAPAVALPEFMRLQTPNMTGRSMENSWVQGLPIILREFIGQRSESRTRYTRLRSACPRRGNE